MGIIAVSVVGNILRNAILTFFHGNQMDAAFEWLHDSWGGDLYSAAMLGSLVVLVQILQRYVPDSINLRPATDGFAAVPTVQDSPVDEAPQRPLEF